MYFQKNLNLIAQKFPHLVEVINNESNEEFEVESLRSKNNLPIAQINKDGRKIYLNSLYDPVLEAQRWVSNLKREEHSSIFIFGAGFFYALHELRKQCAYKKTVIYEPSIKVLTLALHEVDLTEIITESDILIIAGSKQNLVDKNVTLACQYLRPEIVNLKIEVTPAYKEIFAAEWLEFKNKLWEEIRLSRINLATSSSWGKDWLANTLYSLKYIIQTPGVRHFFGQFKGVPAIVVSAGPSLEKNIHLLPAIKEKALIICAGSTIRAMMHHKVKPHILMAFDLGDVNNEIYNDQNLQGIYLGYSNKLYHGVVANFPGRRIYFKLDTETLSDMITYKSGGYEFGMLRSGFSISHTSLDFAVHLGCDPIILIGQDLAYSSNKRYADGQLESLQRQIDTEKLWTHPGAYTTKDVNGEEVVSSSEFDNLRLWFERVVPDYQKENITILNATEGGVAIKGVPNRKLVEVITEYCQNDRQISARIEQLYFKGQQELKKYSAKTRCIPAQIDILMDKGIAKMNELINRTQQLRQKNLELEFDYNAREEVFKSICMDYDSSLNYQEYIVLLKDVSSSIIQATYNAIYRLGEIKTAKEYDLKLQYWLAVLNETKQYLEHIKECNHKSGLTGGLGNGQLSKDNRIKNKTQSRTR